MMSRNPTAAGKASRPSGAGKASAAALTPKEVLGMLRRHVWLVLFMILLGSVAGSAGWYLVRRYMPLYKAETVIKVLPPVQTDPMEIVASQVQQDLQYGHRVSLANLMKMQSNLEELIRISKVRETKWFQQTVHGDATEAVKSLDRHLNAFPQREAEHIVVSMTCGSPSEAALIVNEVARLFVSQHTDTERGDVNAKLKELYDRQNDVQREMDVSEQAMQQVREKTGISDLERPAGRYFQHTITLRLNDLELQESEMNLAIKQLQADIGNLRHLAEGPITEQISHAIEQDPVMVWLAQQLALYQAQLSGRLTKFGENHRSVRQTQELIDKIERERSGRKTEIAEQTRRANLMNAGDTLRVLQERLSELQRLRNEAQQRQTTLDDARAQYEQAMKKRDERMETLNQIKMQIEKLKIMLDDPATPKVQLVGEAPRPLDMVISRNMLLWIPGGTMLGLVLGLAFAFLIEMLNDLVRKPSDVHRFLNISLLAVIPDADEDRAVDDLDLCRVVDAAPYSFLGEAYRRCRTNLELSRDVPLKSLLVASGGPGDGRTSVACNLASAFVAKFEKVLLIDANLRQPSLHYVYPVEVSDKAGVPRLMGLTSILTGECDYPEAICPSGIQGLDLIYAGPPASNPAELLASQRMRELIENVAGGYDRVIIDSPPVLLVSDVKILAKLVSATVLVFNAALTRRGAAERTIRELQDVGANVVGCVLFAAEAIKGGYFRQQFKAYRRYLKAQLAANSG